MHFSLRPVICQFVLLCPIFLFVESTFITEAGNANLPSSINDDNTKISATSSTTADWDGTAYLTANQIPGNNSVITRQKRFVVGEALIALIVWNIVVSPLLTMTFTKNIDIFGWFKKCARRSIKAKKLTCMPTLDEIKQREFARNIYVMAFSNVQDKTAKLIQHQHNLMVGLKEPDTWDKMSERQILFLLLVKYRLLEMDTIPLAFLDENSVQFWEKWCKKMINKEDCNRLEEEVKKARGEDFHPTEKKPAKNVEDEYEKEEDMAMTMTTRPECVDVVNRGQRVQTDEDAKLVADCLQDAQNAFDLHAANEPPFPEFELPNKHHVWMHQYIKELFEENILSKKLANQLNLDLMAKEKDATMSFLKRIKHFFKFKGNLDNKSSVKAIRYVPYVNSCLVKRDDNGHGPGIELNPVAIDRYPAPIRHVLKKSYTLAADNLKRMDFMKELNDKSVIAKRWGAATTAADELTLDDIRGHISRVYVLIQMRRTVCQIFLYAKEENEKAESIKEQRKEREKWAGKAPKEQKRKKTGQKQNEKNYKQIINIFENMCTNFYERNKQERAYLRWSPSFKAVDDLATLSANDEEDTTEGTTKRGNGLKMAYCHVNGGKEECEYMDYNDLLSMIIGEYSYKKSTGTDSAAVGLQRQWSRAFSVPSLIRRATSKRAQVSPLNDDASNANANGPRRKKRLVITVLAVAFAGGLFMQQIYKHMDLVKIFKNCARYWYNFCKTPKHIKDEMAFIDRAKRVIIEEMPDELIPQLRRQFELHYIDYFYKGKRAPVVPSEYLATLGIRLSIRHGYLLDCFIYDWDADAEKMHWDKTEANPDNALINLIELVSNRCQGIDEFIKKDSGEVPTGLLPLSTHSQMIAFLEGKKVEISRGRAIDLAAVEEWEQERKRKEELAKSEQTNL